VQQGGGVTGFFIKKAFFDGWDNFISLILFNVVTAVFLGLGYGAFGLLRISLVLGIGAILVWFVAVHLFIGTLSFFEKHLAFYQRPGLEEFKIAFKASRGHALLLSLVDFIILVTGLLVIPFYFGMSSFFGTLIGAILVWILIITLVSLNYYLPVASQLKDRPYKSLKKAYIIALDNPLFSFFLGFYTLVSAILSVATALLIPGLSGILLSHQDACKLLMFKYDYLEEEQITGRRTRIPWGAILIEEKEKVGHRSIKGMIFPWKE
jgi:hypothetical protein